jgi:hypothetical protein
MRVKVALTSSGENSWVMNSVFGGKSSLSGIDSLSKLSSVFGG